MTPGLQWVSLMLLTRIGWAGRRWALPFLTALVVSARYDRRKGRRHKTVTDYAQQMLVCLRRWLPDRDLVVVADGGYAKREFLRHCQSMSKPIVVVTKLRKDASRYQPAPPRRPGQIGRPGWSARDCPVPRRCWTIPLPNGFPTAPPVPTAVPPWSSSLRAWRCGTTAPRRAFPYVGSSSDTWRSAAGLCFAMHRHRERNPCGYCSGICCGGRSEVTPYQVRGRLFEELRAHLGLETQRQWSERAIARTTPALFGRFSVVTLAADILIEQRGAMAPHTAAWYDKTSPSFADAVALVRRHLWVQRELLCRPSASTNR